MTRRIFPMSDWAVPQDGPHGGSGHAADVLIGGDAAKQHPTPVIADQQHITQSPAAAAASAATSHGRPVLQQESDNSSRSRSMSLSFASWRHRPKSAILPDDLTGRFSEMTVAGPSNARKHPRGSIDGLAVASGSNAGFSRGQSAIDDEPFIDGHENEMESEALAHGHAVHGGKSALKGMIRRASVSIHGLMQRRSSFAASKAPAGTDEADMHATAQPISPAASSSLFPPHWVIASAHNYSQSQPLAGSQMHPQQSLPPAQATHAAASSSTHPNNTRPTTSHTFHSWRRLKQAASFRHSRVFDSDVHIPLPNTVPASLPDKFQLPPSEPPYAEPFSPHLDTVPSPREMRFFTPNDAAAQYGLSSSAPLTGGFSSMNGMPSLGTGPPTIPPNTGGAARAAAAAAFHQELLLQSKPMQQEEYGNDHESGIGIALTAAETDSANGFGNMSPTFSTADQCTDSDGEEDSIKIDFIAKLPVELSVDILARLDSYGLATAARVSRAWYHILQTQQIWRESFLREKTKTYASTGPIGPGTGLGVPHVRPSCDWRKIYRVRQELDRRWQEGKTRPVYLNGHSDSIYCLQFDESKIITGSRDKTIRIWDMHTFACRLIIGPPSVIHDSNLLYDEDGDPTHYITTAYQTRSANSMPAAVTFPMHHNASILCLQYDDRILVTGSSDASCIVYSVKSGYRPVRRLRYHSAAILDLCFDERYIVTCSKDISICVWDRETGSMLKQMRGHAGPVNAVQMRGNTVVSCSGDFMVKLWDIDMGHYTKEFAGHTKGLACSQFSEDGRFIASAGNDKTIRIWDAQTGECVREMKAHQNLVRSLHIDSVSGRLVSGSYDTDIKVFDMETGRQLLDFPRWHQSWVLSAKSDYRRIISTGQDPKILVMDFGANVDGIEMLESTESVDGPGASNAHHGNTVDMGAVDTEPYTVPQPGYI